MTGYTVARLLLLLLPAWDCASMRLHVSSHDDDDDDHGVKTADFKVYRTANSNWSNVSVKRRHETDVGLK